jgi:predicted Zn-dependent protease
VTRWNRREVLAGLGVATATALLGCRGLSFRARPPRDDGEVRTWLRDAVSRLAGAFPEVHAHAVSGRRTQLAVDAIGSGGDREATDGVVLAVRDRDGRVREEVTFDLSGDGVRAAVLAITDGRVPAAAPMTFTASAALPVLRSDPARFGDRELSHRLDEVVMRLGQRLTSRAIYHGVAYDLDDTTIWSVTAGVERVQRLVRVLHTVDVVGWTGTRPLVGRAAHGWRGGVDLHRLTDGDLDGAVRAALEIFTPGGLAPVTSPLILEPSVVASLIDALARQLLTTTAAARPEVARLGEVLAVAPALQLVDDPGAAEAYGGFAFDDEGEVAAARPLLDGGRVVGRLADRAGVLAALADRAGRGLRAGHLGELAPAPSHLRLAAGTTARAALLVGDAVVLEGGRPAVIDLARGRVRLGAARAREVRGGQLTGRVYADVELVGDLAALLASLEAPSREVAILAHRGDAPGGPRWSSIEAPWLRAHGTLRQREGAA